jgi:hypothetical protein
MNVMFQVKDESLDDVEQKLRDALVATREFIEAVKSDQAAKPSHGIH